MPGTLPENHIALFDDALIRWKRRANRYFPEIGGFWKIEPQKRSALHAHIIIFPNEDFGMMEQFREWAFVAWNKLVGGDETHLKLHREGFRKGTSNWIELTGSQFALYFSKYIGKEIEESEVKRTGRWWGMFNATRIPFGEEKIVELAPRQQVRINRWARKLREKKAHNATMSLITRKQGKKLTVAEVQELKNGRMKGRNIGDLGHEWYQSLRTIAKDHNLTLGPPPLPSGGAVTLCFKGSVEIVHRWIEYVEQDLDGIHGRNAQRPGGDYLMKPSGLSSRPAKGPPRVIGTRSINSSKSPIVAL